MSILATNWQSHFAYFTEDFHNCEQSSDGGSASNSDAEPEVQDSEPDDSELIVPEVTEDAVLEKQSIYGCKWQRVPPGNKAVPNLSRQCSLTKKSEHVQTMDECFHLFINEQIIDTIVLYTNKKANESNPQNKRWKPVDRLEIDAFLGLLILIGRFKESRECKDDLWRQDEALSRQFYAAVMSRDRFVDILRYIRFDDSATRDERRSHDKLAPLRDVTNIFVQNCMDVYDATDNGCIDEQLVTFRGHCSFKVSMPSKPGKCGIKLLTLCDSKTFYCCNMQVYLGKHRNSMENHIGQHVVKQLTDFWKHTGRCITMDHLFTDLNLAEELLEDKLFLVGTMHKNTRDLPKILTDTRNRCLYSSEFLFNENLTLVSYIPKPKKCIILLSTLHHERNTSKAAKQFKPDIINYYNSTKSGVHILYKLIRQYSCRRSTRRWPLSLFMHYIDIAAYNAFVIWHTKYPTWKSKHSVDTRRKTFLEELAKKMTAKNIDRRATMFENKELRLNKNVIRAIEATGRNIVKISNAVKRKRARCCFCISNDNKYSSVCNYCKRHVCNSHSRQEHTIVCNICNNINER